MVIVTKTATRNGVRRSAEIVTRTLVICKNDKKDRAPNDHPDT